MTLGNDAASCAGVASGRGETEDVIGTGEAELLALEVEAVEPVMTERRELATKSRTCTQHIATHHQSFQLMHNACECTHTHAYNMR